MCLSPNKRIRRQVNLDVCLRFVYCIPSFFIKMSKAHPPELKKYMDKKLSFSQPVVGMKRYKKLAVKLNGGRHVTGILRGFDPFMNLVVDEGIEEKKDGSKINVGMVVIRGNSIIMLESLDRI